MDEIFQAAKKKSFEIFYPMNAGNIYIQQLDFLMPRSENCDSSQVRMLIICKESPQGRTKTLQWKFKTQNIYRPFFES
jgi:hypothetical protein